MGLAAVTRYIGLAFVVAGASIWVLRRGYSWRDRTKLIAEYLLFGILPSLLWLTHNWISAGRLSDRELGLDYFSTAQIWAGWGIAFRWFLPRAVAGYMLKGFRLLWPIGLAVLLALLVIDLIWRRAKGATGLIGWLRQTPFFSLVLVSILSYILMLIAAHTWFDSSIPLDERLLSPLLPLVMILVTVLASRLWSSTHAGARVLSVGLVALILVANAGPTAGEIASYYRDGRGYLSRNTHDSPTYAFLRQHPGVPIYSNSRTGIYFWLGTNTQRLPSSGSVPVMKEALAKTGGFLVIFNAIPVGLYHVTESELTDGLTVVAQFRDATIYAAP
jgi:hypothetical protein